MHTFAPVLLRVGSTERGAHLEPALRERLRQLSQIHSIHNPLREHRSAPAPNRCLEGGRAHRVIRRRHGGPVSCHGQKIGVTIVWFL